MHLEVRSHRQRPRCNQHQDSIQRQWRLLALRCRSLVRLTTVFDLRSADWLLNRRACAIVPNGAGCTHR